MIKLMASQVKVQGKTIQQCLDTLKIFSKENEVEYRCTFGFDKKVHIVRETFNPKESIYLSFMWRHKYHEFDNSC